MYLLYDFVLHVCGIMLDTYIRMCGATVVFIGYHTMHTRSTECTRCIHFTVVSTLVEL